MIPLSSIWTATLETLRVVASALLSAGILAAVVTYFREWFVERIKSKVKKEYEIQLEKERAAIKSQTDEALQRLRSDLDQRLAMQGVALANYSATHAASAARRIQAVENLWNSILELRQKLPSPVTLFESVNGALNRDPAQQFFEPHINATNPTNFFNVLSEESKAVEKTRPLVGELLWGLFTAYRMLWFRSIIMFRAWWDRDPSIAKILKENAVEQLVASVLGPNAIVKLNEGPLGTASVRVELETKIVLTASRILNGEQSADHGLEQATRIGYALAEIERGISAAEKRT